MVLNSVKNKNSHHTFYKQHIVQQVVEDCRVVKDLIFQIPIILPYHFWECGQFFNFLVLSFSIFKVVPTSEAYISYICKTPRTVFGQIVSVM